MENSVMKDQKSKNINKKLQSWDIDLQTHWWSEKNVMSNSYIHIKNPMINAYIYEYDSGGKGLYGGMKRKEEKYDTEKDEDEDEDEEKITSFYQIIPNNNYSDIQSLTKSFQIELNQLDHEDKNSLNRIQSTDKIYELIRKKKAKKTMVMKKISKHSNNRVNNTIKYENFYAAVKYFVGRKEYLQKMDKIFSPQNKISEIPILLPLTGPGGIGKSQLALYWIEKNIHYYDYFISIDAHNSNTIIKSFQDFAQNILKITINSNIFSTPKQFVDAILLLLKSNTILVLFEDANNMEEIKDYLPSIKAHILITSRNTNSIENWPSPPMLLKEFTAEDIRDLSQKWGYYLNLKDIDEYLTYLWAPKFPIACVVILNLMKRGDLPTWKKLFKEYKKYPEKQYHLFSQDLTNLQIQLDYNKSIQSIMDIFYNTLETLEKKVGEEIWKKIKQLLCNLGFCTSSFALSEKFAFLLLYRITQNDEETQKIFQILEEHGIINWNRHATSIYLYNLVQHAIQSYLFFTPDIKIFTKAINSYVGDKNSSPEYREKWESILPHLRHLTDFVYQQYQQQQQQQQNSLTINKNTKRRRRKRKTNRKIKIEREKDKKKKIDLCQLTAYLRRAYVTCTLLDENLKWADLNWKLVRQCYSNDNQEWTYSLFKLAHAYQIKSQHEEAIKYFKKFLKITIKQLGANHLAVSDGYYNLGYSYDGKGCYDQTIEYYRKALDIRIKKLDKDHYDILKCYHGLGIAYSRKSLYDQGVKYIRKCLEISIRRLGKDHEEVATAYNNLGVVYDNKGQYNQALKYYQKALTIARKQFGEIHQDVALYYNNLGSVQNSKGHYDQAIEYCQKALEILSKIRETNHFDTANIYHSLGLIWEQKGQYDQSIQYHKKCLDIRIKKLGDNHPDVARCYTSLSSVYDQKGDYDIAIEYCQKSLKIVMKRLKKDHPDVAKIYNHLGSAYFGKGQYDQSIKFNQKSLEIRMKKLGKDHPDVARSYFHLGLVYQGKGHLKKSMEYLKKCVHIWTIMLGESHSDTKKANTILQQVLKTITISNEQIE